MGLTTNIHAICDSEKFALKFNFSVGNCYTTPEGKKLIELIDSKILVMK